MNTKPFFLPSEVARLVLGYLISHGFEQTTRRFLMECSYLEEYKKLKSMGFEYPTNILGLSLVEILDNFGFMKTQALERYNLMASTDVLWRELDSCLDKLKYKLLQTNTNKLNCAKIRSQRKFPDKNVKILPENIGEILLKQGKVLSSKQLANTIKKVHETISTNESIKENHTLPNGNVDIENADLADEDVLSVSLVDDKEISDATNENKDVIQGIKEAKQNLFRNNQQQKETVINKEQIISINNNQNKDGQILNVDGCTPIQNTKTVLVISSPNPKTNFSPAKTTSIPLIASTSQIDIQSIGTTNSSSCISTASRQESSSSDLNKPSATKLEVMTGQQPDVSVSLLSTNCSADNLQPTLSKPIYKSIGTQSDLSLMTTHEFTSSTPSSNKCDISSEVVQSTSVEIQVDTLSKVLSKSSVDKDLPSNANTLSSPLKVATVQDDQPVDPQLLNGHKLNPQPLNDHALDPQPLNDHALDPQPLNDHALDPQPLNDHALDPQPLNDHALDPQPLNDHALDPQPLNDHALDPQPLNGQEAVEPQNISTCHENNQSTESFLKESELTTQATSLSLSSSPPPILLGIVSGISSSKNLPDVYKTPVKNPQNLVKSPPRENIQSESLNTPTREKNALFSESLLTPIKQSEFDNSKSKRKRYPPEKRFIDIPIPGSSQLRCESGNSQDGSHLKDSIPTFVEKVISETSLPEVLAETINRKLFGEVKSETLVKNCENKISEEGPKGECDRLMDEIMLTDFHMTKSDIDEVIHQTNSAGIPVLDDLLKLFASVSEEKDNISGDEDTEPMYNNMEFEELDSCSQSAQNRELKQTSSEDSSSNPNPSNNEKPIEAPTTFLQVVQKLCSNDPSSKSFSNQPSSNASPKTIDTILEHEQEELENSTPKILSTTETHAKDLQTLEAVNSLNNSKPNQTKSLETKDLSTDKHPTSCSRRTKVFSKGKSRKLMPVSIFNPSDQIIHNQEVPHSLASQPIITQESSPSTKTSHTHPDLTQSITASSSMKSPSNRTPIISQQQINETTAVSSQTNFSQSTTIHPSEDLSTSNTLTSICSSAKDTAPISATDPSKLPLEYSPVSSNPYLLTTTTTATTITANASVLKTNVDNSLLIEKPPLLSAPLIEPVTRFSASISQSNTVVSRVLQPQETASLNQFPVMYIIAPPAAPVPVQFSQAQLPPIETGSKPPQNNVPTIELDNGLKIPIRLKRARGRPRKIPPTKRSQPKLYNIAPNINTNPVSHPMKSIETVSRPMKTIETDLHLPSSEKVTLAFSNDNSWTIEMDPQSEKIVLQLKNPNTNQLLTYEMSAEQVKDHLAAFIGTSEITDYIVETMQSYKKAKPKTKPPILSRRRTAKTKVQNKCGDIRKGKQVRAGQSRDHLVVGGELGAGQSRDHLVVGGELGAGQSRDHLVVGGELRAGQSRDHLVVGGELGAGQSRDHLVVGGELRAGQSRDHLVVGGELGAGQSRDHLVVGGELRAGQSRDHLVVGGELRAGQSRDHLVVGGELRAGQSRDHLVVGGELGAGQSRDHLVVGGELRAGQSRDHLVVGGELGAGQSRDHLVVGGELRAGQSRDHLVVGGELRAGQSRDHLVVGGELGAGQSRDHLVVGGELGAGQSRDHLVVGGELGESFTPSTKSNRSMISCRSDRTEAKALNPENTEQNEECILYYATPLGKVEDFIRNTRTFFKGSPKQIMTSSPSTSPTIKPSSSSSSQITRATTIPSSPSLATRATTIPSSSTLLSSLATKKSSSSSSSKRTLSSTQTKSPCLSEEPISIIEISDSSVSYLPSPPDCPSNKEVLPEDSAKGFLGQINALTSSSPVEAAANNSPCKNKDEIKNTDFPIKENEFLAIDILSTLCYNECSKTNHPEDTALQTSKPDSGHSLDDMSARSPAGCYRILMEDKSEAHSSDMSDGNLSVSQEDQEGSNSTYPVPFDKSCKISNETTKCSSPSLSDKKKKRLKMKPNEEKTSSQKKKTTTSSRKKSLDKSTHRKAKGQPVKRKLYEAFPDQEKTVNKICRTDIDLLLTKLHPDSLDGFDGNT